MMRQITGLRPAFIQAHLKTMELMLADLDQKEKEDLPLIAHVLADPEVADDIKTGVTELVSLRTHLRKSLRDSIAAAKGLYGIAVFKTPIASA